MTLIRQSIAAPEVAQPAEFVVPESRTDPGSRQITLRYLRLPSTGARPGYPLIFLTGGPGSAAIPLARGNYRPLFDSLRETGDVILLDQRGTGLSNSIPTLTPTPQPQTSLTREGYVGWYRSELPRCWKIWKAQGVAIDAYNTRESAADVEDLRKHLGATKLNLFGISYGTHLAQAVIKYYPASVGRVALAGLEGLDQTVKRPARVDAVLQRVDKLIGADLAARAACPDLLALMRRVHERMDREPVKAMLPPARGAPPREVLVGGFAMQLVAGQFVRSTTNMADLPAFYARLDKGDFSSLSLVFPAGAGFHPVSGMAEAMDMASGISPPRLAMVQEEAKTAALGDALGFPMPHIAGLVPGHELGEDFRAPIKTSIPALLIAGDLDGRTPLEEQQDVARQFTNASWITVENAGHDVVLAMPVIGPRMLRFFRGESLPSFETLRNAPVRFRV